MREVGYTSTKLLSVHVRDAFRISTWSLSGGLCFQACNSRRSLFFCWRWRLSNSVALLWAHFSWMKNILSNHALFLKNEYDHFQKLANISLIYIVKEKQAISVDQNIVETRGWMLVIWDSQQPHNKALVTTQNTLATRWQPFKTPLSLRRLIHSKHHSHLL